MVNIFSVPLPFTKQGIEKLSNINSKSTKSQINVLYGCLPANSKDKIGFEQSRNLDGRINDFYDFFELVKYAFEKVFEFIYLLNSPETPSNKWLIEHEYELNNKLEKLLNFGIKKYEFVTL